MVTLLLEIAIIYCAPFITWVLDLKWSAGETFFSEYSVVIALRWFIVIIFQLPLLLNCFSTIIYFFNFIVYSMRKALAMAKKIQYRNRNPDGTFAEDENLIPKRRGRPKNK